MRSLHLCPGLWRLCCQMHDGIARAPAVLARARPCGGYGLQLVTARSSAQLRAVADCG